MVYRSIFLFLVCWSAFWPTASHAAGQYGSERAAATAAAERGPGGGWFSWMGENMHIGQLILTSQTTLNGQPCRVVTSFYSPTGILLGGLDEHPRHDLTLCKNSSGKWTLASGEFVGGELDPSDAPLGTPTKLTGQTSTSAPPLAALDRLPPWALPAGLGVLLLVILIAAMRRRRKAPAPQPSKPIEDDKALAERAEKREKRLRAEAALERWEEIYNDL